MSKDNVLDFGTYSLEKEADKGIAVTLVDETTGEEFVGSDGLPIVVTIKGRDSASWQNKATEISRRNEVKYKKKGAPSKVVEQNLKEILATVTASWTPNIILGGEILECTYDNALELYSLPNAISEQLIAAGVNRQELKKS
jgi:hypothetical protein